MFRKIHPEYQYLNLIKYILHHGDTIKGRNGKVLSSFGHMMKFDLKHNTLPLITTKKMPWKTCVKELLWFLRGETDNLILKNQGVHIWDKNASRNFLNSQGLKSYREDDLGPIYGFQWRNFNGNYTNCDTPLQHDGIDQLDNVIQNIKNPNTRFSRRHIISAWNPLQLHQMALPPCHILFQFHVNSSNELSCSLYQRSGDVGLGIPFNIASYSVLTMLIAKHCELLPGMFIHHIGNAHIYEQHQNILKTQIERIPQPFPFLNIITKKKKIEDYKIHDFEVINYIHHKKLTMDMVE